MELEKAQSDVFSLISKLESAVSENKLGSAVFLLQLLVYDKVAKKEYDIPKRMLAAIANGNLPPSLMIAALITTSEFKKELEDARRQVIDRLKCQLHAVSGPDAIGKLLKGLE